MLEFQLHKYEAAADDLTVVLRANPANTSLLQSRGIAYKMTSHFDEAAADFKRVMDSGGGDPLLPDYLCDALARSSKPGAAIQDCAVVIKEHPYSAIPFAARGYAHYRLAQYAAALADFDIAVSKSSNRAQYLYARGMAEAMVGKNREAKLDMQRADQLSPGIAKNWKQTSISP